MIDLTNIDFSNYERAFINFDDNVVLKRKDSNIKKYTIIVGDNFKAQEVLNYINIKIKI